MKHFRLIGDFDVLELRRQIAAMPSLWNQHTSRKVSDGTPHSGMSDIWIRYRDHADLEKVGREKFNEIHVPVWYPAWWALPALKTIVFGLMAKVQGEMLGGILITRIPTGDGIARHVDTGWHVETYQKFYVSIESEPGARFYCDHDGTEEFIEPCAGDCFLFDNRKLHWVVNDSGKDRLTLIICIRTEKFGSA